MNGEDQLHKPIVIGVAGGTSAGKTTVALTLLDRVGRERVAFIQHDAYYRDLGDVAAVERARVNYDHPDSLETELLVSHIRSLVKGNAIESPLYDFNTHSRQQCVRHVEPKKVILVEGLLIFADRALRDLMDIKIYVDADPDLRFIRRLQRDIVERSRTPESIIEQYLTTVRPMHLEFIEPSKRYADVIIPQGGFNTIALDMIVARVEKLLEQG
jgi:uridine kinase